MDTISLPRGNLLLIFTRSLVAESRTKLAELLLKRAELTASIAERQRVVNTNVQSQAGDAPSECGTLRARATVCGALGSQPATVSGQPWAGDELTVAGALLTREHLKRQIAGLNAASVNVNRYSQSEIKMVTNVSVKELRDRVKALKTELSALEVDV
jgi:hypothetical protein